MKNSMIRKIVFWASLPMLVVPFISMEAAPATVASLQSYRWYNNHYHGGYDQYYRWYYNRYNR